MIQFSPLGRCCEARAGRLSTRRHRENSFQHWGGAVKLVWPVYVPEMSEIVVLIIVETYEARVGVFKSQKRSRKQFSPLWKYCETRRGLFKCQEESRNQFTPEERCCEGREILFKCQEVLR